MAGAALQSPLEGSPEPDGGRWDRGGTGSLRTWVLLLLQLHITQLRQYANLMTGPLLHITQQMCMDVQLECLWHGGSISKDL